MVSNPERAKTLGLGYDEWRWVMFEGCMADNENMNVYAKILAEWMGKMAMSRLLHRTGQISASGTALVL
jgi:hypothetical protein